MWQHRAGESNQRQLDSPDYTGDGLGSLSGLAPSFLRHQGAATGDGEREQLWDACAYMASPNTFLSLKSSSESPSKLIIRNGTFSKKYRV